MSEPLSVPSNSPPTGGFLRALGLGLAGALAGAAVHWAVHATLGLEAGYASLVLGFLVGAGVRRGARRGGRGLQLLAMALTYLAIALSYIPMMMKELAAHGVTSLTPLEAGDLPLIAGILLLLPLRNGLLEPKSLFITGLALFQAWRMTRVGAGANAAPASTPSRGAAAPVTPSRGTAAPVTPAPTTRVDPQGGTLLERAARQLAAEESARIARR